MSYLTDLVHRRVGVIQTLGKSVAYAHSKLNVTITDAEADKLAADAEAGAKVAADAVHAALAAYITAHAPFLPANEIAEQITSTGLRSIETAIAGATNMIKANN